MVIQALSDTTLIDSSGTRLFGVGEKLILPTRDAVKVMLQAPAHFKILEPTPIIPGVALCWSLPDDRVQGPGTVQLVKGCRPHRVITVLHEGALLWIAEQSIIDIDPWPAIDAKLENAWPYLFIDGEESPKFIEVREWLFAHFDEDKV